MEPPRALDQLDAERPLATTWSGLFERQRNDLSLFALLQVLVFGLGLVLAKLVAVTQVFPRQGLLQQLRSVARTVPYDLLSTAALVLVALLLRRLRPPAQRGATIVLVGTHLAITVGLLVTFVNVEFFISMGSGLNSELIRLAPNIGRFLVHSLTPHMVGSLLLTMLIPFLSVLITPIAHRALGAYLVNGPSWSVAAWGLCALLGVSGAALVVTPPVEYHERTIRRMTLAHLFLSGHPSEWAEPPAPTPSEAALLQSLAGQSQEDGAAAFSRLKRRRYNVVLWSWESVGERYLKSHSALGQAATPNLDRLAASLGEIRFTRCYAECPLSVQTAWAIVSGMSPAAETTAYLGILPALRQGPMLPAVLKRAGYRTAHFNGSYLKTWGEANIYAAAGFDTVEDIETLPDRERYAALGWAIDGRAVTERFLQWVDSVPSGEPFFATLWSAQTHHPYSWPGMPDSLAGKGDLDRYNASIERSDELLGLVWDGLVARGMQHDTLLIVVGDHGEGLGRWGRPYDLVHSFFVNEDDLHVPLVFLHEDLGGQRLSIPGLTTHADLLPTILDLCGLPVPEGLDGFSLARPVPGRTLVARSTMWWPTAIFAGRYKLVLESPSSASQLFDVLADPTESSNLSQEQPRIDAALRSELLRVAARRAREEPGASPMINGVLHRLATVETPPLLDRRSTVSPR